MFCCCCCFAVRPEYVAKCISIVKKRCSESKIRSMKLVRATMEEISVILDNNAPCADRIKVVHLLRDPRGKENSHIRLPHPKFSREGPTIFEKFCPRIYRDVQVRKQLEKKYRNTFLEMHYEDVAENPVDAARRLYSFALNSDVPRTVIKWYSNISQDYFVRQESHYGLIRKNSTTTSQAWKTQLPLGKVRQVEATCANLIRHMKLDFVIMPSMAQVNEEHFSASPKSSLAPSRPPPRKAIFQNWLTTATLSNTAIRASRKTSANGQLPT